MKDTSSDRGCDAADQWQHLPYELSVSSTFSPRNLIARLTSIPFAPIVSWGVGPERFVIGIGDLLLATVFPLAMRKAFGRSAGIAAMAINLGTIAATMAFLQLARLEVAVPLMTGLGPLMVVQYAFWARRRGPERTTWEYLRAEPLDHQRTVSGRM